LQITRPIYFAQNARFFLAAFAHEIVAWNFPSTRIELTARQPIPVRPPAADAAFSNLAGFPYHGHQTIGILQATRALRAQGSALAGVLLWSGGMAGSKAFAHQTI
jgi:hypothetical protein